VPAADRILDTATDIARQWQALAVIWHVAATAFVVAWVLGWRPPSSVIAPVLIAAVVTVDLLSWGSGNPFTGVLFALLAALLVRATRDLPAAATLAESSVMRAAGAAFATFGLMYPHFLAPPHWIVYAYAAPFGLLPCPTLSAVIGFTMLFGWHRCAPWSLPLAAAGALYGFIGVFTLRVALDWGLVAASLILVIALGVSHASVWTARASSDASRRVRA